jgi:hypothetical protein
MTFLGNRSIEWGLFGYQFIFHPHSYGIATLMRIGVKFPSGRKFMLHHFRPHAEQEFHDHPWPFRTWVLWGAYLDESLNWDGNIVRDYLRWGSTRRREALHAHRTSCKGHVWTFVVTGPKERTWCRGTVERWICGGKIEDFDSTRGMVKVGE